MAGRIKDEDIQLVRERARIDEVVEQYVTLRNAGGGSRKGLCPFHDEKTPSFNVRPAQGFYHCFGCGASGDVFTFLREIEGLGFVESVERLAAKYGIQLQYEEGTPTGPRRDPRQRQRLLEAHRIAGEFYAEYLSSSPEAQVGRQFVTDRGFDQAAAQMFGMGFAPRTGEALVSHLRGKGFTDEEMLVGGLASRGQRGLYDRFRGRLLWPIREMTGEIIGFGARRMFDDDRVEAKYLNTSETPIYKKSQVLYGIDLARRQISGSSQAVVVEGYTDVMACHQAGVRTAVATCGTAFGDDHARVLRRVLLDHGTLHGEVIFTFDGDEAGQRAAMKAFEGDQAFVAQTYVAVEPRGMDPCDLRLADGDASVRELVASRVPLYRFVLDNILGRYDLDRADQRIDAVRESVGLTSSIRDKSKVEEFLREIATQVGVDVDQVRTEQRRHKATPAKPQGRPAAEVPEESGPSAPFASFGAPQFADEREALKAIAQYPHLAAPHLTDVHENDFTHPVAQELWRRLSEHEFPTQADAGWLPRISDAMPSEDLRRVLAVAAVEPLRSSEAATGAVVASVIARLQLLTLERSITEIKSKLQRTNPVDEAESYNRMFGELIALEQQKREMRDRSLGD
ncbi:DNA primase [Aeromicrobium sp. CTD01-1L150]|uniref:DNA primase n=1 Tax=Aeromicrobium sp. CTD01-1L150 TaxID=3341830 RepID=UPI0035BFA4D9